MRPSSPHCTEVEARDEQSAHLAVRWPAVLRLLMLTLGSALAVGYAVLWLTTTPVLGQEGEATPAAPAEESAPAEVTSSVTATVAASSGAAAAPQVQSGPRPDQACRLCHVDSTAVKTLPSGETLNAGVDLAQLDASVHGIHAAQDGAAGYCTDCHQPKQRYQYPHAENPAQTLHEFEIELSGNCESCHVAAELHNPGHLQALRAGADPAALPVCADCHGGHDVEPSETLEADTTAFCQGCHAIADFDDPQTRWAHENLLAALTQA
ncbi:MAG: cytochrome c3 family protein, partial [Caldilineaceae bacterium]